MAQLTAQASGLASAGSTWVGGVAPVDGDCIKIPAGFVVTQDVNRIYGSKAAQTFAGVEILGTSAASFGEFVVNDGVTLTLRGFNNDGSFPGWNMYIHQWGKFSPQPGSTILTDVAADDAGAIANEGIINAVGTAPKPITFDIPAANKNWNTAHTASPANAYTPYDRERSIGCVPLGVPCLSNAAGTDIGTFGDSSVSFSAMTPAGLLTTPVASIAALNSAGKYFVDHQGGYVFFYTAQTDGSTCNFTVTAKKLAFISARIRSRQNWDGNQAVFRYTNFVCMGTHGSGAVDGQYKTNAPGTTRRFEVTNCLLTYSYGVYMGNGVAGVSGDPVLVEDNEYVGLMANDTTAAVTIVTGSFPYLSIQRNKLHLTKNDFMNDFFSGGASNMVFRDNVTWTNRLIQKADRSQHWDGADLSGNAVLGRGGIDDTRVITGLQATLAAPATLSENLLWRVQRGINCADYNDVQDSVLAHSFHHMLMGQDNLGQGVSPRVRIKRNVVIGTEGSGALETGYNYDNLQDGPEVEHNTLYKASIALSFGDQSDSNGMQMQTQFKQQSNLVVQAGIGVRRIADTTIQGSRVHFAAGDFNNVYGSTTADFSGTFARFSTPSGLVNCTGVSLFNPSFSAPVSGKTLALVVGSSTSRTLAWDGGTPVELYREAGTVTAAEANATWPSLGYLNDSSKAWPVLQYNNAASPVGAWVLMTSGANAGQVRRVLNNNTGSRLILAYAWTSPLAIGDTYQLWRSEVVLSNAGATQTISAGIDFRVFPSASQTDAAVAIAFNGKSVDPAFVDPTRGLASWDLSLGGPGTEDGAIARLFADPTLTRTSLLPHIKAGFAPQEPSLATAAHDGTTIGAMGYVAPPASASGTVTLPHLTASGTAQAAARASGVAQLPHLAASGTGAARASAGGAVTLPHLSASGSGTAGGGSPALASGAVALPRLRASGAATSHPVLAAYRGSPSLRPRLIGTVTIRPWD